MKKKYLKTVEDVLALKDTDTKIYKENADGYYQFVNGVICRFVDDYWLVGSCIDSDDKSYILEEESEEPIQEASEKDVGKLCWFWDFDERLKIVGKLVDINENIDDSYQVDGDVNMKHCRPLTKEEIKEFMEKAE